MTINGHPIRRTLDARKDIIMHSLNAGAEAVLVRSLTKLATYTLRSGLDFIELLYYFICMMFIDRLLMFRCLLESGIKKSSGRIQSPDIQKAKLRTFFIDQISR